MEDKCIVTFKFDFNKEVPPEIEGIATCSSFLSAWELVDKLCSGPPQKGRRHMIIFEPAG